jgi:hypothetical protein
MRFFPMTRARRGVSESCLTTIDTAMIWLEAQAVSLELYGSSVAFAQDLLNVEMRLQPTPLRERFTAVLANMWSVEQ